MSDQKKQNKRLVLFVSSCIALPALEQLNQTGRLAGVILPDRVNPETQFLTYHLQQSHINSVQYNENQVDKLPAIIDQWQADTGLIFTFSHILPDSILQLFSNGIYNVHASSLPAYRGAMPLYWQIRHREENCQLSIVQTTDAVDEGDIVFQDHLPLEPEDTIGSFSGTLAAIAPGIIMKFLDKLDAGSLIPNPQTGSVSKAPFPSPEDLLINWQEMSAEDIAAMARAGNPTFNGAQFKWRQFQIALLEGTPVHYPDYGVAPGTVLHVGEPEGVVVATPGGALRLDILAVSEGFFSGSAFAERFHLEAGIQFS